MRNGNNPDTVNLNEIDDAKGVASHLQTPGLKSTGFTHFRIASDFRERLIDEIKESISQKFPASFIEGCRAYQLTFGQWMIFYGFHSKRAWLWPSPARRKFL
jgi:hypothetical protein